MCVIFSDKPTDNEMTKYWLKDMFSRNSDGIGVMYEKDGQMHVEKSVGSFGSQIRLYRRTRRLGVPFYVHFRYATHGDKDELNCHPYAVFDEENPLESDPEYRMYLMHNGVLRFGNAKDKSKSDTWHFIHDQLRPMLKYNPELMFDPTFIKMLGSYIENNRFAIMDSRGNSCIVNDSQWVDWDGRKVSNTYAWSASKAGVFKPYTRVGGYGSYGGFPGASSRGRWADDLDDDWLGGTVHSPVGRALTPAGGTKVPVCAAPPENDTPMLPFGGAASESPFLTIDDRVTVLTDALCDAGFTTIITEVDERDMRSYVLGVSLQKFDEIIEDLTFGRFQEHEFLKQAFPSIYHALLNAVSEQPKV